MGKQIVSVPATTRISTIIDDSIHSVVCEEHMGLTMHDYRPRSFRLRKTILRILCLVQYKNIVLNHLLQRSVVPLQCMCKGSKEYGKIPEDLNGDCLTQRQVSVFAPKIRVPKLPIARSVIQMPG